MPITKINSLGVNLSSPLTFSAGTASLPSITFSGDTNTGVFSPTADAIGFTEGGSEAMRIDSSGNVGIGTTTVNSSGSTKSVSLNAAGMTSYELRVSDVFSGYVGNNGTDMYLVNAKNGFLGSYTNNTERMRINSAGNLRFSALASGSAASTTAYLLDTTYPNALIFVAGQENLPVNMSFYMGIAVRSSTTYTLTQIAKPAHGNGFGTVNVAMNGNYLNISFAAGSGNYAVNVIYFFG